MCIPIIYIFMCKNTKDVQCKKQLHVDGNLLFSHPRGLTVQHRCILTAWGTEKGCLICFSVNLSGSAEFHNTVLVSTSALLYWRVVKQSWLQGNMANSANRWELSRNVLHNCKATVDGHEVKTQLHFVIFVHLPFINKCISCLFMLILMIVD